nr:hypothetical protein [Tanacetum cinerariifolium]
MCKAYGGEPFVDLFRSFLNLGRAGDWLTLSSRGGADVPKTLTKPVTHLENWKEDPHGKAQKVPTQARKVADDASTPFDVDSDPDMYEFPSDKELKDATDCHWVTTHVTPPSWKQYLREISIEQLCDIRDKAYMRQAIFDNKDNAYAEVEKKCNEALKDLDKNPLVFDMRAKIETLQSRVNGLHKVDGLRQDRAVVVARVILDAAMKLIRSDEMGFLITRLVKASIIHGRCAAFEELLSKKPQSLQSKHLSSKPS